MTARVHRLVTRPDSLRREQAAELRQLVLRFEEEAPAAARQLLAAIDRHTAAQKGWSFVMLSPAQNHAVVLWIADHATRPKVSAKLWATLFCHMRMDTGEITLDRKAMAEAVGARPQHVSAALQELLEIGALIRHQEGREVRWLMNPRVATCLTGLARERAQTEAPKLSVVSAD